MPVLGAAGLLAIASGASAQAPVDTPTPNAGVNQQVFLGEEEISDVSLATFYVFDTANWLKPGVQLARGGCGGGCGCGHGCDMTRDHVPEGRLINVILAKCRLILP
jgi:hypothetical protein